MAFALTITTTHTKTLISPSNGSADKVYGADYVSATSHTSSVTAVTGELAVVNGGTGLSAGTSGGVLSYTATGTLASSALLAANSIVIGGGAGAAPLTSANLTFGVATGEGLVFAAGTATTDVAAFSFTRTNNNAAVATGVKWAFTDTLSAAGFLPFQILGTSSGAVSLLKLDKDADLTLGQSGSVSGMLIIGEAASVNNFMEIGGTSNQTIKVASNGLGTHYLLVGDSTGAGGATQFQLGAQGALMFNSANGLQSGAIDTSFSRTAAGQLAVGTGATGSFAGGLKLTNLTINRAATFLTTSLALTDGAGAQVGTLTSSPAAGNPSKWIGIDDNGTTRYIPAW